MRYDGIRAMVLINKFEVDSKSPGSVVVISGARTCLFRMPLSEGDPSM